MKQKNYPKTTNVAFLWQLSSSIGKGLLTFLLFCMTTAAIAQTAVSGKVTDEKDGSGLPGVSILVKGTNTGTQSDVNGAYKINVPANATLVFTYVGKTTKEIAVGNQAVVNVKLADDTQALSEVVVIGYGTQKKKDLTGSISSITSEDFVKGPIINAEQLVNGKLAGVQITQGSGQPGAGSQIRIRGGSSLNASNDPLFVIDNVPVDNNGISGAASPLNFINPADIESISILKDASAAAIYGSRAANGVILITTKKGKKGDQLNVNFSTLWTVGQKINQIDVLSANSFRTVVNDRVPTLKTMMGAADTDWQGALYRTSLSHDNNVSITGALGGTIPFRVSLGYLNQNGILKNSNMNRTSGAIGISPTFLNNHLRVDINLKGAVSNNLFADQGAIGAAINFDPTQSITTDKTAWGGYFEWLDPATNLPNTLATRNPVALLLLRSNTSTVKRSIGNVQFDYKFHALPDLRANLNLGYDVSSSDGLNFTPAISASAQQRKGVNTQYSQTKSNKLLEFYLNYVKDLPSISSHIDFLVGHSYQDFIRENPSYPDNTADGTVYAPAGIPFKTQNTLISFYGRLNYALKDRYLLTLTLRDDGSSRFSPDNRWGLFPSAAFAWKLSEESFIKNSNVFSDLKLRLGYGITGQQDVGSDYPYLARYTLSDNTASYQFGNTYTQTLRAEGYDANIKWESTETTNAGIDIGLKTGSRISASIDYYKKKTKDLLSVIPVPAGSNLTNQILTNVGNIENEGIEFAINANPVHTTDFSWDFNFNVTYNKRVITNLNKVPDPTFPGILVGGIAGGVGNTIQIHTVGYAPNAYYVYKQV